MPDPDPDLARIRRRLSELPEQLAAAVPPDIRPAILDRWQEAVARLDAELVSGLPQSDPPPAGP